MLQVIDLETKFGLFDEQWEPRIIGAINDLHVKIVKLQGEFVWHRHESEDELFWLIRGALTIRTRDGEITLSPGQMTIVPRGVEHQPVAAEEAWVILVEPATTLNTGNVRDDRTVEEPAWI
ncbi:MAG: cupin domain-containing protein [Chloroflexota bacterium]